VLLLSNMVNTGTYVRLLRHLGIALIFAPEPFTTPFGVAFILAARHLSKRHETSLNNRLRETLQYYLAHTSHFGEYADGESGAPAPVKRRGLSEEHPILGQITGSRSFGAKSSVRQGGRHIQKGTANHTTDMEWLSRRYESANGAVAYSSWATTSGGVEGLTHHSVNMGLLSQRYGAGSVGNTKAEFRATNIARRRQRYGSAVNCTTVLSALQDNNNYYDMLSRRNVIGGY
jgi:hypothetical protein